MNRASAAAFALAFAFAGFAAAAPKPAVDSLIKDGAFDLSPDGPSAEYSKNRRTGFFTVTTEDGSWNRCGKLSVGKGHKGKHGKTTHYARIMVGWGDGAEGFAVEPETVYDLALELKGDVPAVHVRSYVYESDGKGGERCSRLPMELAATPSAKDWKRVSGKFRTPRTAKRAQIEIEMWSSGPDLKDDDFVLIDNIAVVKSADTEKLFKSGRKVAVAPVSPVSLMACPFLPSELAEPPEKIELRAAVNEQKPLPLAVGNLTDAVAQYRVVLETEPKTFAEGKRLADDGAFGLEGFPAEKITVREAVRFKESDAGTPNLRLDPLPRLNEMGVITVPPHEAGLVWYDFDTRGVEPGTYSGRIRVIPLGEPATYEYKGGRGRAGRYERTASSEVFVPVSLTVDPIVLPREAARPGHMFCQAVSRETFNLLADIGVRAFQINTFSFSPKAAEDPENGVVRHVRDVRGWAKERGIDVKFFVEYSAFKYSQRMFNRNNDPSLKWKVWGDTVRLIKRMMNGAGVDERDYYVETCDEPFGKDVPDLVEAHRIAKEIAPNMNLFLTLCVFDIVERDFLGELNGSTDMWIFLDHSTYFSGALHEKIRKVHGEGRAVSHYLCSTSPSASLASYYRRHCWRGECRGLDYDCMYEFLDSSLNGRGTLSFKRATRGEICYMAGDVCVPSIRYMAYREGVTDVKYIAALRAACAASGGDVKAREFLASAARDVVVADPTSRDLPAQKREEIREMILRMSAKAVK